MKKLKRIMVLIMTTSLLLTSFTGCSEHTELEKEQSKKEKPVVTEAPADLEEESSAGAEREETVDEENKEATESTDLERPEMVVEKNYLEYTLSEEDIAAFEAQLLLCEQMLQDGASYADMEIAADTLSELASGLIYQSNIAEIIYHCDMKDEEAVENHLFSAEVVSETDAEETAFLRELYASGEYERYFEDDPEVFLKYLEAYSEEAAELEFRNEEIQAEFYDLGEEEFEEKIAPLYCEFINNYNEIAQMSGYDNYYDYATALIYKRDFGSEERELFREYVKTYIVPLYYSTYEQHEESYTKLSRTEKRFISELLYEAYDSLDADYVNDYFATLPESSRDGMLHMFEEEAYVRVDNENALEGAYTTGIGVPFCYFGPGMQPAFTIVHEIGHYYADYHFSTAWISFDLCEVHSQGNEMLFLTYLETVLEPEIFEALEDYRIYYFIDTITVATLMDEFEEAVYLLPDDVDYTAEDFDALMEQLIRSYGFAEDDEYIRYNMQWLWRNVGISYPAYYLSYGTSAMASLSLYNMSQEDYDAALEAYRILVEEADENKNFTGTLEKAGIDSIFEEAAYIKLRATCKE